MKREWYENYAFALYFDKQYEKSLQEIEKNLVQKPSNPTLLRLRAYNLYELGRNEEALVQMEKFFETVPQDKQIYLDFIIMGRIQAKVAREELAKKENANVEKANVLFASAIENFNKALAFEDAKAIEAYKELASTYVSMKNYELAIQNFEKFMEGTPKPTLVDFNAFGQMATDAAIAIYLANQKDVKALQANQQLFNSIVEKGAKAYSDLITLVPHLQAGYTGRAYIYSLVDAYESDMTEKHGGVAKPYYDEALAFYLQNNTDGKFNKNIIDAYLYYAGYYIKNNDTKNAVENYRKVLAIDPTNESALKTLKLLNVKP